MNEDSSPLGDFIFKDTILGLWIQKAKLKFFISLDIDNSTFSTLFSSSITPDACPCALPSFPTPATTATPLIEAIVVKYLEKSPLPSWLASVHPIAKQITSGLLRLNA